jgi:transposase
MEIILYYRLSTRSRRALLKTKKSWGRPYYYSPRGNLLERLSRETGMNLEEVYQQLMRERKFFLDLTDPGL